MLVSAATLTNAHAQSQNDPGADKLTAMLVRPGGWNVDYSRGANFGEAEFVFESRGGKVVGTFRNLKLGGGSCEREVTVTSDAVKFDGCYDSGIILHFDPNDQQYPFKGTSALGNYEYKLKPK